ncbi:hypothetical protein KQI18_10630 [Clostridioides mangenotii]|uniref:hypothetical protein n=1 Tax=Metaclostridioides mangenotii TaxID=1540 RepID=UPI001C10AF7B|nr:hypothetical protein [Clostridioides mangenotii]MBU5308233.1 hypothetical protein [Clostridioides mangenotii]
MGNCDDKIFKKSCFFNIPAKQFSLLSSIIGLLLIDNLNTDQQNSLGNFIVNIGQNITTSAAQESLLANNNNQDDEINAQLEILKKQICFLEDQVKKK